MLRPGEDIGDRPLLDHLSGIEHHDAVAEFGDCPEIMGYEEDGATDLIAQFTQQMKDLGLQRDVESRRHLIGNENFGALKHAHGDGDALAHATGELEGIVVELLTGIRNAHPLQRGDGPAVLRSRIAVLLVMLNVHHLPANAADGAEGRHGILKHHGDTAPADHPHGILGQSEEVLAVKHHLA